MSKKSFPKQDKAKKSVGQKRAESAQNWVHLRPEMVQRLQRTLDAWLGAVESRTERLFRIYERQNIWKRTFRPVRTLKQLNWERGITQIAKWIVEDWNSAKSDGEKLTLTGKDLINGRTPLSEGMRPSEAADLQQPPQVTAASRDHLISYLHDLTKSLSNAQLRHITAERSLREMRAATYESLGIWPLAAAELDRLARANAGLLDFTYAVRAMLRKGIALYRIGKFDEAKQVLMNAVSTLERELPPNADLRTEIALWDYLGLCLIRLGESRKALRDVYLNAKHRRRTRLLSTPLGDASRWVRTGIAYLELDRFHEAKEAFVKGAKLRVSVGAWPEAARALRYLGHWYFRKDSYQAALTVWAIALKRQRVVGDDIEQARLLFQRGEAFRCLKDLALSNAGDGGIVGGGVTDQLFPDKSECALLRQIQGDYDDIFDYFPIAQKQYDQFAYVSYYQCIESAKAEGLDRLVASATGALNAIANSEHMSGDNRRKLSGVYTKRVAG